MPLLAPFAGTPVAHAAGIRITSANTTVTEGGANGSFEVRLMEDRPDSTVVIEVISQDSSEIPVSPSTLTSTRDNWSVDEVVPVTPVDDALVDGTQTANVLLRATSADARYNDFVPTKPLTRHSR